MMYKRRLLLLIASAALLTSAVSCSGAKKGKSSAVSDPVMTEEVTAAEPEPDNMEIIWVADYDLNPQEGDKRSTALALFEDVYGGSIKYVKTAPEDKYGTLDYLIITASGVDMFPYDDASFPDGVIREQFEALDPYFDTMGMDEGIWDDMRGVIDSFAYNGQHYVIPYDISDPFILTYSRKLMQSEGLEDPYKLYTEGKWDWNTFMDMMEKFKNKDPNARRYGIGGWFGRAILASTGHTVVGFDGSSFTDNINDPEIEKAERFMQDTAAKQLYRNDWLGCFPADHSTLFYGMGEWSLGDSTKYDPEGDIMAVPFPKAPDADKYYLSCGYKAKMLAKYSPKGKAVAAYIKCERLAASSEKFADARKPANVTDEQYALLRELRDPSKFTPVFDWGYGMGERMNSNGDYNFGSRGAMNNLDTALLTGDTVGSWGELRDKMKVIIDEELKKYGE